MLHCVIRCVSFVVCVSSWALPAVAQQPAAPQDPIAALAAMPPQPAVERGVRVCVQDADGKPVPDAALVFADSDGLDYTDRLRAAEGQHAGDEPAIRAALAASGTRFALDERGETSVPRDFGFVFAAHGERCAFTWSTDPSRRQRIVLRVLPPRTGTVEVVDADGAPAADVMFRIEGNAWSPRFATGADGRTTFRICNHDPAEATIRLLVASRSPLAAPLPTEAATVRFQLPVVAAVEAELVGEMVPGATIGWTLRSGERRTVVEPHDANGRRAVFRHVEVGAAATVRAAMMPGGDATANIPAVGKAGERIELVRTFPLRVLAVQVLDPEGHPIRARHVRIGMSHQRGGVHANPRTTSEGWLELEVPASAQGSIRVALTLGERGQDSAAVASSRFEVKNLTEGINHCGAVTCTWHPIALQGVVVDPMGRPICNERIGTLATDGEGRFALRMAEPIPATVDLGARAPWYFVGANPTRQDVPTGPEPVRIVVQRAARIRYAAPDLRRSLLTRLEAHLEPTDGGNARIPLRLWFHEREPLVPAGKWDFVVTEAGEELHRIEGLHAEAGIEVHDARFMDFDWRAFSLLLKVAAQESGGTPASCTVHLGTHSQATVSGIVHLLVAKTGGPVRIAPKDTRYAPIDLGVVTTDQIVRFGSGPQLRAHLSRPPQLPDGVQLLLCAGDATTGEPFDAGGHAAIWLPLDGDRTPHLRLRKGERSVRVDRTAPALDIPIGGRDVTIEWTDAVQRALDAAAKQL